MKPLPLSFIGRAEVRGVSFLQLERTEKGFLYQRTEPSGQVNFEVFKRIENKGGDVSFAGTMVHLEPSEQYPSSGAFGISAWAFNDKKKAYSKFRSL